MRKYAAGHEFLPRVLRVRAAPGQLIPVSVEVRQQGGAALDGRIVTELQLRGACARGEPFQPSAHAGSKLAGVAEAHRARRLARRGRDQCRAGIAIEVDEHDRTFRLPLLRVRKNLACPLGQPAVGQFDLPDRHGVGICQAQQQCMAIRRIAGNADGVRRQIVGHRGDGAVENLRQPVIRMQFLPQRSRRRAARQRMHQHQLLADIESALQELGLHSLQFVIAFEQGLQARRILLPQRMPQRDGLICRVQLAVRRRLRFSGEAARQLRVQVGSLVAHHFGDRRALARSEGRGGQRAQLTVDGRVQGPHACDHKRLGPALGAVRIGKRQRRNFAAVRDARLWGQNRCGGDLRHWVAGAVLRRNPL
jgi:hypothetical protein